MKNWNNVDELVKNLKADFKRNGIKATVRRERAGWTPSLTININTTEDDFVAFEEFAKSYYPQCRYIYTEDNKLMRYEDWCVMEDKDAKERIRQHNMKRSYNNFRQEHQQINHYSVDNYKKILSEDCITRIKKAVEICNGYNYDNSDTMTDYFDVGFYQHFELRNKDLKEVA